METSITEALKREFGYVPQEDDGEKWTVFRGNTLVVLHPERLLRVYRRGCGGTYHEIDPAPF